MRVLERGMDEMVLVAVGSVKYIDQNFFIAKKER
jgi:hypothetical protein